MIVGLAFNFKQKVELTLKCAVVSLHHTQKTGPLDNHHIPFILYTFVVHINVRHEHSSGHIALLLFFTCKVTPG